VHHLGLAFRAHGKSTLLEDFQHRDIIRQDLGDQFLQPGDRGEMMQECPADAPALVCVDQRESHLCFSRLHDDVSRTPTYYRPAVFLDHCDQRHVLDEVDSQEDSISGAVKWLFISKKRR
jgi:hypothetical protein